MRHRYLLQSVHRLLAPGQHVTQAAYVWSRHRLMPVYSLAAFVALLVLAVVLDFEAWTVRVAIGLVGAAVATSATSEYRVLAATSEGLILCRGSRIRQRAVAIIERLPASTVVTRVGGNLLINDWEVGGLTYSATRIHDKALERISTQRR